MRLNKRGVALLQVLIISALLAGLSSMILRAVLARTKTARQTRRTVSAQLIIESCMAQIYDTYYTEKGPGTTKEDIIQNMNDCAFDAGPAREHSCTVYGEDGKTYTVKAEFTTDKPDPDHGCTLKYTIQGAVNTL